MTTAAFDKPGGKPAPLARAPSKKQKKEAAAVWNSYAIKLPAEREQGTARSQLWDSFDTNGNGYLSLAEVHASPIFASPSPSILSVSQHSWQITSSLMDTLGISGTSEMALRRAQPAISRGFKAAKAASGVQDGESEAEYVVRLEFRLLLVFLQRYFSMLALFGIVDTEGGHADDRQLDLAEFESSISKLEAWGVSVNDTQVRLSKCCN